MARSSTSYNIYMDESGWDNSSAHFGSVAAITMPQTSEIYEKIKNILPIGEIKWKEIHTHDKLKRALDFFDNFKLGKGGLRVDILTWRKIDKLNYPLEKQYNAKTTLGIMYGFVIMEVMRKIGWKRKVKVYPDELTNMGEKEWKKTMKIIQEIQKSKNKKQDIKKFNIKFKEKESSSEIFVQVADFMAGFMRSTWELSISKLTYSNQEKRYFNACEEVKKWLSDKLRKETSSYGYVHEYNYFSLKKKKPFGYEGGISNRYKDRDEPINFWKFRYTIPHHVTKSIGKTESKNDKNESPKRKKALPSFSIPYKEGIEVKANPPTMPTLTL